MSVLRVHCGAECPSDCRRRPCGCGRLLGDDTQSMSVRDNPEECSTPDQIYAHEEISQWVAPCLYKSWERLSSHELVLRLLEKCRHSLE